jgi:3-oxoacyl-[acyl-carrier protein] reductase
MRAIERHVRYLSSAMTKYIVVTGASKGIGRAAAGALADDGISANAVAPGPTETELFRANNPQGSERQALYLGRVPMRRFVAPRVKGGGGRVSLNC